MFHTELRTPETELNDYYDLKRDDVLGAIDAAKAEGFHTTGEALIELLRVLDSVLGEGGRIEYRVAAGAMTI